MGNSVIPKNLRHELVDEVHWVGAFVAYRSAHKLLREHGLFVGPTSGAAAVVGNWISQIYSDATVAVIMPDEGFRHGQTVFNPDWLATLAGWDDSCETEPETLEVIEPRSEAEWTRYLWDRATFN